MKWFSVKEKLPPTFSIDNPEIPLANGGKSNDVLIFDGENIGIGYYESEYFIEDDPDSFEGQAEIYSSATWSSNNHMNCTSGGFAKVTHWAFLPEGPK